VVVIASVAVVARFADVGLMEHCGASAGVGVTEQVKKTEPVNPFAAVVVTVEVLDCPGLTVGSASADRESVKSIVVFRNMLTIFWGYIVTARSAKPSPLKSPVPVPPGPNELKTSVWGW
jgi:hypothetical protein